MSYIFKKGDIVRVKKVVGDDPSLMRENQIIVNTLVHQYFIKGGKLGESDVEKVSFQQMVGEF